MTNLTTPNAHERIEQLTARRNKLRDELNNVEQDISVLQRAIEIFNPSPPKRVRKQEYLNVDTAELNGKRLEEALIYIANKNNGIINSRATRPLLVEAGVLRGKQSTTSHALSTELAESVQFIRLSRGRYRLETYDETEAALDAVAAERHNQRLAK